LYVFSYIALLAPARASTEVYTANVARITGLESHGSDGRAIHNNAAGVRCIPLFLVNFFLGNRQIFGDTADGQTTLKEVIHV
jgi:hypothetical protein